MHAMWGFWVSARVPYAAGLLEMLARRSDKEDVRRRAMDCLYGMHHLLCKQVCPTSKACTLNLKRFAQVHWYRSRATRASRRRCLLVPLRAAVRAPRPLARTLHVCVCASMRARARARGGLAAYRHPALCAGRRGGVATADSTHQHTDWQALALGAAPRMPSVGASNGSPRSLMHASPATSAATTCAGAEGQAARAGDADMLRSPGNGYGTVGGVNNGGEGLGAGGGGLGAAVHSQHPPPATVPPATTRGGGGDDAGAPDAPDAVSAASAVGAQASVGSSSSVHAVGAAGVGDAVGTAGMEGAHVTSPASAASSGLFARFFGWGGAEGGTGKPVADATVACQKVEADERVAGQQSGTVGAREYDALFGTHVPQDVVPPRPVRRLSPCLPLASLPHVG